MPAELVPRHIPETSKGSPPSRMVISWGCEHDMTVDAVRSFSRPELSRFLAYWQSLPKSNLVPDRTAIRPEAIPDLLRFLAIIEFRPDGEARFRLVGSEHERNTPIRAGMPLTGMAADSRTENEVRARVLNVVNHPCGLHSRFMAQGAVGISYVETLSLPLIGSRGEKFSIAIAVPGDKEPIASELVQWGLSDKTWYRYIDIGAGVPEDEAP